MNFVPSFSIVEPPESGGVSATAVILHGVLGSGQNFRGLAKKLAARRPDYRFVLVDLRHHGQSSGAPPPDTLSACAYDVQRLLSQLDSREAGAAPCRAVIGHSFGGKVALEFARSTGTAQQIWVLDSNPGTQEADGGGEIARVIAAVRSVGMPLAQRNDVVPALMGQGLSRGLATWMTTNLKRTEEGYVWVFELQRIEALLNDYYCQDLWPFLETLRAPPDIHLVAAERSERFTELMRQRALKLSQEGHLHYHLIEDAGHWLHVDNQQAVLDLLASKLAS